MLLSAHIERYLNSFQNLQGIQKAQHFNNTIMLVKIVYVETQISPEVSFYWTYFCTFVHLTSHAISNFHTKMFFFLQFQNTFLSLHELLFPPVLNWNMLNSTALYCNKLHYTTLHYTTRHYTTLHYTTLHYTTLH